MQSSDIGKLYLVATPIGNLSDVSDRVVNTLKNADFIAAEDTRVSRKLLTHFGIKKPLLCYRKHNSRDAGMEVLNRILSGKSCALVTDAGTPGISDPGEEMVRLCVDAGVIVEVIPGPCALICALTLSGFPAGRFVFEGFLPSEKKKRLLVLRDLAHEKRTIVFYEAPHKLLRTLTDMHDIFGERRISISREITKLYEETLRFTLSAAIVHFTEKTPRGEFVLVLEGSGNIDTNDKDNESESFKNALTAVSELVAKGMSERDAVKRAAFDTGCSRNDLYKAMIKAKS